MRCRVAAVLLSLLVLVTTPARAQETGSISGVVFDQGDDILGTYAQGCALHTRSFRLGASPSARGHGPPNLDTPKIARCERVEQLPETLPRKMRAVSAPSHDVSYRNHGCSYRMCA